jgi:hypothetical protein
MEEGGQARKDERCRVGREEGEEGRGEGGSRGGVGTKKNKP